MCLSAFLPPNLCLERGCRCKRENRAALATALFSAWFPMEPERFQTQPFQGWSVEIPPVRSTVVSTPRILLEDHALDPTTTAGVWDDDCAAETGFFTDGSATSLTTALR